MKDKKYLQLLKKTIIKFVTVTCSFCLAFTFFRSSFTSTNLSSFSFSCFNSKETSLLYFSTVTFESFS